MKVQTTISLIKKEGMTVDISKEETIVVKSAWNWKQDRVVIEIDNKEYELSARELKKAIDNATNCE